MPQFKAPSDPEKSTALGTGIPLSHLADIHELTVVKVPLGIDIYVVKVRFIEGNHHVFDAVKGVVPEDLYILRKVEDPYKALGGPEDLFNLFIASKPEVIGSKNYLKFVLVNLPVAPDEDDYGLAINDV